MELPPAGDIALVIAGALVAGFVNGLSGTGYALAALTCPYIQPVNPNAPTYEQVIQYVREAAKDVSETVAGTLDNAEL